MIEMLVKPKKAERKPWELFFVGLFYASLSLLLVTFVFGKDSVLKDASGILVVLFTLISCLPFVYYLIKLEEGKDIEISDEGKLVKEHSKAISALIWLFLGFVVAFSFWYVVLPDSAGVNFNFQIRTFCAINNAGNYDLCVSNYGANHIFDGAVTGKFKSFLIIFSNNISVLVFTIIFSLLLGAGAIFILIWNASVIAAAVGIFVNNNLWHLPYGLFRYMIHGIPEILAYFVGAMAGGIVSVAIIRRDLKGERAWTIFQDAFTMVLIAVAILIVAGIIEVYITHSLF